MLEIGVIREKGLPKGCKQFVRGWPGYLYAEQRVGGVIGECAMSERMQEVVVFGIILLYGLFIAYVAVG